MKKNAIGFVGAALALAIAASLAQAEGLEKISAAGADVLAQAQSSIAKTIAGQKKEFAKKAAECTPNSADLYVPRTDSWGGKYCLAGWELVNRDYISPSCPGVVINPSCVRGGHDRSLGAQSIPGTPGHYYPGTIDNPPDVDCGPTRQLVYVGNDQWACYTGRDRSLKADANQPRSPKGDGQVSSLQGLVDELAPKLGAVKDAESFSRVYGPSLESALGWGTFVDSPMFGDRFSITVRYPANAQYWDVSAANGILSAPGADGAVELKVWAIQPVRRGGHDR